MTARRIAGGVTRGPLQRFTFDGRPAEGYAGESVAAALMAMGILSLRRCAPSEGGPRGALCFMGVCQECVVVVEGRRTEACRLPVREGLEVRSAS